MVTKGKRKANNHDVLCFSSDLLVDNYNPLYFFLIYFNSHYMFRRSGPDHMLLHTGQNQKGAIPNFTLTVKVKVKFGTNRCS